MSRDLIFRVAHPLRLIEVSGPASETMGSYRQFRTGAREAGGVLIGARRGPHFEIVLATAPQKGDSRSRYGFVRGAERHRSIVISRWRASSRKLGYVGEWHTHAQPIPNPSVVDRRGWKRLAKQIKQPLVHLIVGTSTTSGWLCDEHGVAVKASIQSDDGLLFFENI